MPDEPITLDQIPEEHLRVIAEAFPQLSMSAPWQYSPNTGEYTGSGGDIVDADGFSPDIDSGNKEDPAVTREKLQQECWLKAHRTPQVNTAIRGQTGRLTGFGFEITSEVPDIQDAIEEIELDPRNRLYNFWPKYVTRAFIEGELRLCCTVHEDGFIEVDFIDPAVVRSPLVESGIIFHPRKTTMPLIYCIRTDDNTEEHIPSIFIARYPELMRIASQQKGFDADKLKNSRRQKFKNLGGYFRFIIEWDKSTITKRNVGHVRTILEWLNHWETLKKYEIDHKKSAGAYLWEHQFQTTKAWMLWLQMSDEDRRKTGIAGAKSPGTSIVTGPDLKTHVHNPNLPSISGSDTDIMAQVTSGLNESEDVTTGSLNATFASAKASRGPMSDRTSDEIAYFDRFLIHDFWSGVFFLKSQVSNFPRVFRVKEAVDYKNRKPVFKIKKKRPEQLIEISFPTSEVNDAEARARAFFGSKHASLHDTAGLPMSKLVKKMGFGNYRRDRLQYETEKEKYPDLPLTLDAESEQEKKQAEPSKDTLKKNKEAQDGQDASE